MNHERIARVRALSQAAVGCLTALMKPASVTALPTAHSVIFDTARELLRAGSDRSAAIVRMRDAYPQLDVAEADRMLREAATLLHASGEIPDTEG